MQEEHDGYGEISAFVDELVRAGLRHVCISPGARSTPLALCFAAYPGLRAWSHIDERSGSFFALGLAKATSVPVVVLCTSGTAAANFHPAVAEARYANVPLVVLTADRPAELRDCGARQAIDQIKMFGDHVKWFVEVGTSQAGRRYFRSLGSRAMATAGGPPPGPVHLNFPFREPLMPNLDVAPSAESRPHQQPYTQSHDGPAAASPDTVACLAETLHRARRGLILAGPGDAVPAAAATVATLAGLLGYPILADPASPLRSGPHDRSYVVDAYDVMLREPGFTRTVTPDVILRLGPLPPSKSLWSFLADDADCPQIVIDSFKAWNDPVLRATDVVHADPQATLVALIDRLRELKPEPDAAWRDRWMAGNRRSRAVINAGVAGLRELFEGRLFVELALHLPAGSALYVANSMPVRDLEVFWPAGEREVRVLCNRGANGIDGFVSSALGAAAALPAPLVAVTGDLGFYHDLNGLLAAKRYAIDATIIVLNNDGGGIFSYLPQAECDAAFREHFLTPHGLDFRPAVEMYGCGFVRVASWEQFHDALAGSLAGTGTTVIEVPVEHARSVELHREIWSAAGQAAVAADA